MVAADYEMKRVAMGLAPSQVNGLNSYLEMSKNSAHASNQNPRWWMACDYDYAREERRWFGLEIEWSGCENHD